jgi:hypothetical protein
VTATDFGEWMLTGRTRLQGHEGPRDYMIIKADADDPEWEREVALVGARDRHGERIALLILAAPKLLAACQAIVDRWEHRDLAEAARMCADAIELATSQAR